MAVVHIEVETVLGKLKKLEEAVKHGMEITEECALDCEENEEGCPDVKDLKRVMLAYVNMSRDIQQWDTAARQTVKFFRESYDPAESQKMDIDNIFRSNLEKVQESNKDGDLEKDKKVKSFAENVWNVHHSGEKNTEIDEENTPQDEEILISQIVQDNLLCPITKTEMKNPVKNKVCGHNYGKEAIEQHVRRMKHRAKCPIVGCPQIVIMTDLEANTTLARELKKRHK